MKNYSPLTSSTTTEENFTFSPSINPEVLKEVTSPDITDLQKRFDLFAQNSSQEDLSERPKSTDNETDSEVELPEHLQKLVDQALAQME